MPQGCATWPAVWEAGLSNWPYEGEVSYLYPRIFLEMTNQVDIVEGVNDQAPDRMTLHTGPGCTMPSSITQTGCESKCFMNFLDLIYVCGRATLSTNCDSFVNSNAGCGVAAPTTNSYGPSFNSNGGGW
jgi:hypothetical protein